MKALFARYGGNVLATLDNAQVFSSLPNLVNDKSLHSFDDSSMTAP
jgi:hypothetical protein